MHVRTFVLILVLISFTLVDTDCPTIYSLNSNGQSLEYCSDLGLPSIPKGTSDSKNLYKSTDNAFSSCCFLHYTLNGQQGTSCLSLTVEEVEDRNIAYSRLRNAYEGATGIITCEEDNKPNGVNYLNLNLLFYLLLMILLNN